ncbi:MAG: chemotaxis response regulator protein-glutamate methylesterase [Proteobacteria bacterium]|nr:chemotaxis response regulator protein-glutamate methylesterase [Pseudomonadota bacterium]
MINVLVVDDSAFMRKAMTKMLESDPTIHVVGLARDGEEGVKLVKDLKPDVVTLDIEMPRMGGLEALKEIMTHTPTPVIMVSSLTEEGAQVTLDALDLGAVDFMAKQIAGSTMDIVKIEQDLVAKVKSSAGTKVAPLSPTAKLPEGGPQVLSIPKGHIPQGARKSIQKTAVIAIGASTGGPKSLQEVLPLFPADLPVGILVVQHMPKAFTGPFADRLNESCPMKVKEAQEGDVVKPGEILVAPGGIHMEVRKLKPTEVTVHLTSDPQELLYKPSVDVMMNSVAEVYPGRAVAVMMTGMGSDGVKGMSAIKEKHGRTIAQDEATCVVYGMPKAVVDANVVDKVIPLQSIAAEVINMV